MNKEFVTLAASTLKTKIMIKPISTWELNSLIQTLSKVLRVTQGVDYKGNVTNPHEFTQLSPETYKAVDAALLSAVEAIKIKISEGEEPSPSFEETLLDVSASEEISSQEIKD